MTTPEQREARAALDAARPAVARLDRARGAEDLAADLIDIWGAVESALRSLVGTTVLAGQALIREARQRQLISFDSANAIAEFQAVNDRVHDTSYRPTDVDVNAARTAFSSSTRRSSPMRRRSSRDRLRPRHSPRHSRSVAPVAPIP